MRGLDPAQHLLLIGSRDGRTIHEQDVLAALECDDVALVWLPSVLYRSGQLLDMQRLAAAAQATGVPIGFDCAHSAGSVPHRLHDWGLDFGVWCNDKYLNVGSDKHRQFDMAPEFSPAASAGAWQISTPSVLGAAAPYGSLAIIRQAGLAALREKSLALTGFLIQLVDQYLAPLGFAVGIVVDTRPRT